MKSEVCKPCPNNSNCEFHNPITVRGTPINMRKGAVGDFANCAFYTCPHGVKRGRQIVQTDIFEQTITSNGELPLAQLGTISKPTAPCEAMKSYLSPDAYEEYCVSRKKKKPIVTRFVCRTGIIYASVNDSLPRKTGGSLDKFRNKD